MSISCFFSWILGFIYLLSIPINTFSINASSSEYKNKVIDCNLNQHCFINCNEHNSCTYSKINCPMNHQCIISCGGGEESNSCSNSIINATYSSLFELNGLYSGMTVYFPPMDDKGNKRGFINTANYLNGHSQSLQFYAINGWEDINTSRCVGSFSYFDGSMHCTNDYTEICDFNAFNDKEWSCSNSNHLCNNPIINILKQSTESTPNPSEITNVSDKSQKEDDILWYIVIIIILFICWFMLVLIYHIKKNELSKEEESMDIDHRKRALVLTPIQSRTIDTKIDTKFDEILTEVLDNIQSIEPQISKDGDISSYHFTNTDILHNIDINIKTTEKSKRMKDVTSSIPLSPIQIMSVSDRLTLNHYESIESSLGKLSDHEGSNDEDHNNIDDTLNNSTNYSSKEQRAYLQQKEEEEEEQDTKKRLYHGASLYLYNSDRAIPEAEESMDNIQNEQQNVSPLDDIPNVSKLADSPTATLSFSGHEVDGLIQLPLPSKDPSFKHNASSSSSMSSSISDITYMTASTIIGSNTLSVTIDSIDNSLSYDDKEEEEEEKDDDDDDDNNKSLRINVYNDNISIEEEKTIDSFSMNTTPICRDANNMENSFSHSITIIGSEFSVDNNHNHNNNNNNNNNNDDDDDDLIHIQDISDTLMISEDNDDTSSWLSDREFDDNNNNNIENLCNKPVLTNIDTGGTTEYDSSTSSMCSEMDQFRNQTADEEESVDFDD